MADDVMRLISATKSDFEQMSPMDLKLSIAKSEGRVVMGQHCLIPAMGEGLVQHVTNTEVMFAMGADMVLLNAFDFDDPTTNIGLQGLSYRELKALVGERPIGFYLGCSPYAKPSKSDEGRYNPMGMHASREHVARVVEWGADFIVLGGDPGTGTKMQDIIDTCRWIKDEYGERLFVFAGKWEDGFAEKVLGDPTADYDARAVVRSLIDAGADCIDLPCPGTRAGITVEDIRELVTLAHTYKPGTLAMCFLNSSVEGADVDTIRAITLMMKQTGADIHAIGDGGFAGMPTPENVHQMSVTLKGRGYTYFRMASTNR